MWPVLHQTSGRFQYACHTFDFPSFPITCYLFNSYWFRTTPGHATYHLCKQVKLSPLKAYKVKMVLTGSHNRGPYHDTTGDLARPLGMRMTYNYHTRNKTFFSPLPTSVGGDLQKMSHT